jgi:hypothetical protein
MKRLLAISILTFGLLPSIPVFVTSAATLSQSALTRHCRTVIGYGPTDPLVGSAVYELRRCINVTKKKFEQFEVVERIQQRADQQFWKRYEYGQNILRESQRSLDKRMENQEQIRTTYYKNTPVQKREEDLSTHRRSRRTIVREREQQLLRERRSERDKWTKAIRSCTYYPRAERESCVQYMLTQ